MSIHLGNAYSRKKMYEEAIKEYQKIEPTSPLFKQAIFNIERIQNLKHKRENIPDGEAPKKWPLLSIVMPVYNVGQYLDASILSILGQTYENFELIIVDDASSDNSLNVINHFKNLDSRIRLINISYNTLGGAGIPTNIGIDAAKGDYVGLIDSDDFFLRHSFEKLISAAVKNDADVVVGDFREFFDDTRTVSVPDDKYVWDQLPKGTAFSPEENPVVMRFSPVPWRKLYKRSFLNKNKIRFVEGDFFFEDNPFHWDTLSFANRVVVADILIAFHRNGREGQTISSGGGHKFSACYMHINNVRKHFKERGLTPGSQIWKELIDRLYRYEWIYKKQNDPKIISVIERIYADLMNRIFIESGISLSDYKKDRPDVEMRINSRVKSCPRYDLSIVIPLYNCEEYIGSVLENILSYKILKTQIIVVDDGSTDKSVEVVSKFQYHKDLIFIRQANKGAGRARNVAIPLCIGEYAFFMDADDIIDMDAIKKCILHLREMNSDLLFAKYSVLLNEKNQIRGMYEKDRNTWAVVSNKISSSATKSIFASLINFPWIRIIKTRLLYDECIFFGPTVVNNDVQYHWHSICAAKNISFMDIVICCHREFQKKQQITTINDKRRFALFGALHSTENTIVKYSAFDMLRPQWKSFVEGVTDWASKIISDELRPEFLLARERYLSLTVAKEKSSKERI